MKAQRAITPIKNLQTLFEFQNTTSSLSGIIDSNTRFTISWGDGSTDTYNSGIGIFYSHTYSSVGTYNVKILSYNKNALSRFWQFAGNVNFAVSDLPASVTNLFIASGNVSGSIGDFSANISTIEVRNNNTISGDISTAPNQITTLYVSGNNTISGDIANMPTSCNYLYITGNNTLSGDIANVNSNTSYLLIWGNNTLSGDVSTLPSTLTNFWIIGNNTITGDISTAPSGLVSYSLDGLNTLYGDVANIPASVTYFSMGGNNTISDYTAGRVWASNINNITILPLSGGLSSTEVDDLLIDLSATTFSSPKLINISGINAARTTASDAAVLSLQAQGVSVTTN